MLYGYQDWMYEKDIFADFHNNTTYLVLQNNIIVKSSGQSFETVPVLMSSILFICEPNYQSEL